MSEWIELFLTWAWWAAFAFLYFERRSMGKKIVDMAKKLDTANSSLKKTLELAYRKPGGRIGTLVTDEPIHRTLIRLDEQPEAWVWYHPHSKTTVRIAKNVQGHFSYMIYPQDVYQGENGPVTVRVAWPDVQIFTQQKEQIIASALASDTGADVRMFFTHREMEDYYNEVMMPTMEPAPSPLTPKAGRTLDL